MCRAKRLATATSMTTVRGRMSRNMAMSGIPTMSPQAGLLIAMATGTTSDLGAGPGLIMRPGDLLRTTMDDGSILAEGGAGARARFLALRSMGRPLSVSLAEALASASAGPR